MITVTPKNIKLDDVIKLIQHNCVGETLPIKALVLVICGKRCMNKEMISTNIHADDKSGVGKDKVIKEVMKYVFYKDWKYFFAPSPTSITYTQRPIKNPDDNTDDTYVPHPITSETIVYVEDGADDFMNGSDLKMILSGDVNTNRTIDFKSVNFNWKKPVVIISTAATSSDSQIVRRLPPLKFDTTTNQTDKIMDHKLLSSRLMLSEPSEKEINRIRNYFYTLKDVYVTSEQIWKKIEDVIKKDHRIHMRSLSGRLIDLIFFSAAMQQHNRKCVGEHRGCDTIEANEEDFEIGLEVFKYMYIDEESDAISILNPRQRNILKRLQQHADTPFSIKEIDAWPESGDVSQVTLYHDMKTICQNVEDANAIEDRPIKYKWGLIDDEYDS